MKSNMGTVDRAVRLVVAAVVVILLFAGALSGTIAAVLGVVAGAFILTGIFGTCPLYVLFGISTRPNHAA